MALCLGLLLVSAVPIHGDASDVDATRNKLTSLSGIRSLIGEMVDTVQVQIESGLKALNSNSGGSQGHDEEEGANDEASEGLPNKTHFDGGDREGNAPDQDLIHAVQMQQKKTQVEQSQQAKEYETNVISNRRSLKSPLSPIQQFVLDQNGPDDSDHMSEPRTSLARTNHSTTFHRKPASLFSALLI